MKNTRIETFEMFTKELCESNVRALSFYKEDLQHCWDFSKIEGDLCVLGFAIKLQKKMVSFIKWAQKNKCKTVGYSGSYKTIALSDLSYRVEEGNLVFGAGRLFLEYCVSNIAVNTKEPLNRTQLLNEQLNVWKQKTLLERAERVLHCLKKYEVKLKNWKKFLEEKV
jgi:hypothetical protein